MSDLHPEVESKLAEIAKSMPVLAEAFREIALLAAEKERQSNSDAAMKDHGASFDDLHICGNCNGTGYTV